MRQWECQLCCDETLKHICKYATTLNNKTMKFLMRLWCWFHCFKSLKPFRALWLSRVYAKPCVQRYIWELTSEFIITMKNSMAKFNDTVVALSAECSAQKIEIRATGGPIDFSWKNPFLKERFCWCPFRRFKMNTYRIYYCGTNAF